MLYNANVSLAENIWKETQRLVLPKISVEELAEAIHIELPSDFVDSIAKHGTVAIELPATNFNAPPSPSYIQPKTNPPEIVEASSVHNITKHEPGTRFTLFN